MSGQYEMLLEQNTDVPMRDGAILRANVYRPNADGRFPVLMTFGPYRKDVPLREFMQEAWDRLNTTYPEILAASSCKHLVFERPDPEMWVLDGYIVINVDSRGAGKSPGRLDPNSPAEFRDFCQPLEPGEIYEVDLEIWPMGLALPRGSRLTLTIQGKDFERAGATGPLRGVAWFTHDDPTDRPPELFAGTNMLHTGGQYQSHLLLPILPI